MDDFTLELLHAADQEAGIPALDDAPRFSAVLNALVAQDIGEDGAEDNTLILSSGDAYIPGLFFSASTDVYGGPGIADILIQNELGFQAIALGNHEFDLGTGLLSDLIRAGFITEGALEESQEVSPVADGPATGEFDATLSGNMLTVSGEYSGLTSALLPVGGVDAVGNAESAVHIHIGDAGENGPIIRNLEVTPDDEEAGAGEFTGTFTLTDEQVEAARNDGLYINLHTESNPSGELRGQIAPEFLYPGTDFPYLSANLDFSTEPNVADLVVEDAQAPQPNSLAASTVIDVNGEKIGVVGATTPTLPIIASPDGITVLPEAFDADPTPEQLDALAAEIQADVDALLAANPDVNKVVLLAHMQQISIEQALAERLSNVDIIVAGGSNTILTDETDDLRDGDTSQGTYPIIETGADGNPVAVVNTDGNYKYVGRLIIDFDSNGVIIPESYNPDVSGAYATDAEGVAALGAEGLVDPEIQQIVDALEQVIIEKESNVFGISEVYLNGQRGSVRTQETNLGNLTADANLAIAEEITGEDILVSIKNGGGIRDDIGQVVVPAGGTEAVELPNEGIPGVKPEGGISETDIANTLRFNNGLTVLDITREGLVEILEYGIAASSLDDSNTQGRFPQVSGVEFSFDLTQPAGDRIQSAAIVDQEGNVLDVLVQDSELVGDADETVKIVTLGFLAGGGDGYPFQEFGSNFVDLAQEDTAPRTGEATFAADGSEQDALAEYLFDNFFGTPFDNEDTGRPLDERLQNLAFRADTVLEGVTGGGGMDMAESINLSVIGSFATGVFDEGAAEINAYDAGSQRLFVVNSDAVTVDILDLSDPTNPTRIEQIDATQFGAGANSVAVSNGLVAVAIENEVSTDPGKVVFFDIDGSVISEVEVGILPDAVTFTPDGTKLLVANEGEPNEDYSIDPEGSVSIIDVTNGATNASVTSVGFTEFNDRKAELQAAGVKLFGLDATVAEDLEPEFIAVSPDGTTAWVTLQENNAVAAINIANASVDAILPLGVKDYSTDSQLDASDRDDAINLDNYPVFGLYQPDAIASYDVNGMTYYVTANEGDARIRPDGDLEDDDGNVILEEGAIFNEEVRVEDVVLDPDAFPDAETLQLEENLGRLQITNALGDPDGDGDFDQLFAYGGRSFSIFDSNGNLVFDSSDDFERITADIFPDNFNSDNDENGSFDSRSDAKGPEPEGVVVGEVDDKTYAFVGLERIGGIMVYDVTDPTGATFVQYINNRNFEVEAELEDGSTNPAVGDLGPEGLTFISAEDSPNGIPLLVVSNEVSGNTTIYQIDPVPSGEGGQLQFEVAAGETLAIAGFGGVGQGSDPSDETLDEVDTIQFTGAGLTAENMQLTQRGPNLEITFLGDTTGTSVILRDFELDKLDNLPEPSGIDAPVGNILFDGQTEISDAFDVFNADSTQSRLWNRDTVTFLNDLDNHVRGFGNSDDVINALGGNDKVEGLSGDDILRGGEGDDIIDGGNGDDVYTGGEGADLFVLARGAGVDTITDFEVGVDAISLGRGLSVNRVSLFELNSDTLVISDTNELLGIVQGVTGLDTTVFA